LGSNEEKTGFNRLTPGVAALPIGQVLLDPKDDSGSILNLDRESEDDQKCSGCSNPARQRSGVSITKLCFPEHWWSGSISQSLLMSSFFWLSLMFVVVVYLGALNKINSI
jgi:hypothetical protein